MEQATGSPHRWLVVGSSALLQSVATENYACYGGGGVPRYGFTPSTQPADPSILTVTLTLCAADGGARLTLTGLELRYLEGTGQQMTWGGFDRARRLQVVWVWDYYRIQSHVVLRELLPPNEDEIEPEWHTALEALRAVQPGDNVIFDVKSACGDIHQEHVVTAAPLEWTSEGKA